MFSPNNYAYMLNFSDPLCNIRFNDNQDLQAAYDDEIYDLHDHLDKAQCPRCGWIGTLTIHMHKKYSRMVCNSIDQVDHPAYLEVYPAQCSNCHHLHALLPEWIVPFFSYTVPFIFELLSFFFSPEGGESKRKTAAKFHLSRRTVSRLLSAFAKDWQLFRQTQTFNDSPVDCEASSTPDHKTTVRRIIHHCTPQSFRTFVFEFLQIAQHFILNEAFTHIRRRGSRVYYYGYLKL